MTAQTENLLDLRALVVDDEAAIRNLVSIALEDQGCTVAHAGTGAEALGLARAGPDIVVVDLGLPDLDGLALTRALRAQPLCASVPVVIITGSDAVETAEAAIAAGATDMLQKPFTLTELSARVAPLLRARRLARTTARRLERLDGLARLKTGLHQMLVHDQGNLVTALLGYLDLIGEGALDAEQRHLLRTAAGLSRELQHMMVDVLDIDRLEEQRLPVAREPVLLAGLIESAVEEAQAIAHGAKAIISTLPERLPAVLGDTPVLRRVLRNVLMNALQHGGEQGSVRVSVGAELPDLVAVVVEDDGPGIPADVREKIFDKFAVVEVRQARLHRGRGLGLAFSRLAARAHGGDLVVEDRPDGAAGARFVLRLPAGPARV